MDFDLLRSLEMTSVTKCSQHCPMNTRDYAVPELAQQILRHCTLIHLDALLFTPTTHPGCQPSPSPQESPRPDSQWRNRY
jgi:hypothetical protein